MGMQEINESIAELYLMPLLELVDSVLQNPVFLKSAEKSLEEMQSNLGAAQAISGIMLPMEDVDKRIVEVETYKAAINLLKKREGQQKKTIELHENKSTQAGIRNIFGF